MYFWNLMTDGYILMPALDLSNAVKKEQLLATDLKFLISDRSIGHDDQHQEDLK